MLFQEIQWERVMGTREKEEGLDFQYTFQGCPTNVYPTYLLYTGGGCISDLNAAVLFPTTHLPRNQNVVQQIKPSRTSRKLSITDIKTAMSRAGTAAQLAEYLLLWLGEALGLITSTV